MNTQPMNQESNSIANEQHNTQNQNQDPDLIKAFDEKCSKINN
jgi:hypothetical protein